MTLMTVSAFRNRPVAALRRSDCSSAHRGLSAGATSRSGRRRGLTSGLLNARLLFYRTAGASELHAGSLTVARSHDCHLRRGRRFRLDFNTLVGETAERCGTSYCRSLSCDLPSHFSPLPRPAGLAILAKTIARHRYTHRRKRCPGKIWQSESRADRQQTDRNSRIFQQRVAQRIEERRWPCWVFMAFADKQIV